MRTEVNIRALRKFFGKLFYTCPITGLFFQISSHKTMWDWIRDVLIPGIYEDRKDVAMSNSTPYIGDGDAVLVGIPRLRQLRVKKGAATDLLKAIEYICF